MPLDLKLLIIKIVTFSLFLLYSQNSKGEIFEQQNHNFNYEKSYSTIYKEPDSQDRKRVIARILSNLSQAPNPHHN